MRTRFTALLLLASCVAFGGDWEFDRVVKAIESHYGTKRTHIPFLGVANLFVKVARPAGASEFKLAIFEDLQSPASADLDYFMSGFNPVVRVHSRHKRESTYIYAGEIGRSTKMLIATFNANEATVIQVKVNVDTLLNWLDKPELARNRDTTEP
jgi:hypothetical protein